jgi:poly(A) polymerase
MLNFENVAWLPAVIDLSDRFAARGYQLVVAGGAIRDHLLDRSPADVDLLSDARPAESSKLLESWSGNIGDIPRPFGVVECVHDGLLIQVVPFHTLECNTWPMPLSAIKGTNVEDHLACSDATINAIALRLVNLEIIDPFDGISDLGNRLLKTPVSPLVTVGNSPLLSLRIARFVADLSFSVDSDLLVTLRDTAMGVERGEPAFRDRLLERMLLSENPRAGVDFLIEAEVFGHLPAEWRHRLEEVRKIPSGVVE